MYRSTSRRGAMGALHPFLFLVVVYGIAIFMAFFICNVVYHVTHQDSEALVETPASATPKSLQNGTLATAMR